MDPSEMFVLMSLIHCCLRSLLAPLFGVAQVNAPVFRAPSAMPCMALKRTDILAPIHAPDKHRPRR